jgi:hypothetical protein
VTDAPTHMLPVLVRSKLTAKERAFCVSLIVQTRRGRVLSDAQAKWLTDIYRRFMAAAMDDAPELIDGRHDAE